MDTKKMEWLRNKKLALPKSMTRNERAFGHLHLEIYEENNKTNTQAGAKKKDQKGTTKGQKTRIRTAIYDRGIS